MRTCIGCRRREPQDALLRLVAAGGAVTPDPRRHLPGRGAYLHPSRDCVRAALRRKAWRRALRTAEPLDTGPVEAVSLEEGFQVGDAVKPVAEPR